MRSSRTSLPRTMAAASPLRASGPREKSGSSDRLRLVVDEEPRLKLHLSFTFRKILPRSRGMAGEAAQLG